MSVVLSSIIFCDCQICFDVEECGDKVGWMWFGWEDD